MSTSRPDANPGADSVAAEVPAANRRNVLQSALSAIEHLQATAGTRPSRRATSRSRSSAWRCRAPGGVTDADSYWKLLVRRARRGQRGSGRSLGRRCLLRSGPEQARQVANQGRRVPRSRSTASSRASSACRRARLPASTRSSGCCSETSWEALEDAGIAPDSLDGSRTGRVRRHHVDGLRPAHRRQRSGAQRHLPGDRHGAERRGRSRVVHARPAADRAWRSTPPARRRWSRSTPPARACATARATWPWPAAST